MKNTDKKNIDALAEIQKNKKFQEYYKNSMVRTRLAVEVYNAREKMGLSQQKLAKDINSTQKIISKLENTEVNIGIELFNRIAERLNLNSDALARIFNRNFTYFFEVKETETRMSDTRMFKLTTSSDLGNPKLTSNNTSNN